MAALTGAKMVQVWATQLLHKPGGPEATGQVGWHQDFQYWNTWWKPESEVFTAWLALSDALSDIEESSGPMCFVPCSHGWGLMPEGNFHLRTENSTPTPEKVDYYYNYVDCLDDLHVCPVIYRA